MNSLVARSGMDLRFGLPVLMAIALALPAGAQELAGPSVPAPNWVPWTALTKAPAAFDDTGLELVVRAAYTAAVDFAAGHDNYFARDGAVAPLHAAIAEALAATYPSVAVPEATIDGVPSKACLTAPGTALRVSSNVFGDGLWLTAVSGTRLFGYAYDPHKSGEIVVQPATACGR